MNILHFIIPKSYFEPKPKKLQRISWIFEGQKNEVIADDGRVIGDKKGVVFFRNGEQIAYVPLTVPFTITDLLPTTDKIS